MGVDISGLLASLERAGGYAALTGLVLIICFYIAKKLIDDQAKRSTAREALARSDNDTRISEIKQDFEAQLERERVTQEFIGRMNDRYDATLNRVTEAFGENSAVLRQAKDEIRRSTEAYDKNTAMLEKFLPTLPKKNSPRKPQVPE